MVNKPRGKGTAAESMVVEYLQGTGWPYAERRALAGGADLGDITGCPGLVWEVKYAGAGIRMGEWMGETLVEQSNARADHGILIIKPRGLGKKNIEKWFAVMVNSDYGQLIEKTTGDLFIEVDEPATYRKNLLAKELSEWHNTANANVSNQDFLVPFVVRKPPGSSNTPENWYMITYLHAMVTLLRSCGYGSPLDTA